MTNERINQHLEKFLNFLLFKVTGLLLIVFLVVAIPLSHSSAATVLLAFGGKIKSTAICTCPGAPGVMLTISGAKGGTFFWDAYTTQVYSFGNVTPQVAIKGLAIPIEIACWQISTTGCTPGAPYGMPIQKFGTAATADKK